MDGAIHRAAGRELLEECGKLNGCETGKAKITKGYKLPAKYVIHTVGPVWHGGETVEAGLLRDCYRNSLDLAKRNNLKTIAFPSISTGAYRFPIEKACQIALDVVTGFLNKNPGVFEKVVFVLFSEGDLKIYQNSLTNRRL